MDTWCSQNKTVQDTCGSGVMLGPAELFHFWTGAATLALDRLPLWQWFIKGCPISYVSMTASGLTNVTKLCFISKSPVGPSQESIWIRRENYSSCSLFLTDCSLCVKQPAMTGSISLQFAVPPVWGWTSADSKHFPFVKKCYLLFWGLNKL